MIDSFSLSIPAFPVDSMLEGRERILPIASADLALSSKDSRELSIADWRASMAA
jgi:hypothetical protein